MNVHTITQQLVLSTNIKAPIRE